MKHFTYLSHPVGLVEFTFEDERLLEVNLMKDGEMKNLNEENLQNIAKSFFEMDVDTKKQLIDLSSVSPFQRSVLIALLEVPIGNTITYKDLAQKSGHPKAIRPVAHAVATNPIPLIIPCHRVIRSDSIGEFAWGREIKKKLLESEGAL